MHERSILIFVAYFQLAQQMGRHGKLVTSGESRRKEYDFLYCSFNSSIDLKVLKLKLEKTVLYEACENMVRLNKWCWDNWISTCKGRN